MSDVSQSFASDIEKVAENEPILGILLGSRRGDGWFYNDEESDHPYPNQVITWDQARPVLAYSYDTGYGGADCHAIFAWTDNKVLFVAEYDGATHVASVPRHPSTNERPFFA